MGQHDGSLHIYVLFPNILAFLMCEMWTLQCFLRCELDRPRLTDVGNPHDARRAGEDESLIAELAGCLGAWAAHCAPEELAQVRVLQLIRADTGNVLQ